jgi:Lrp/AsnC family transcriptional regulator, leucine-responsive regulatory protein
VHVSTATCYRRTQRLFQEGYIHTVRAEIVPARVSRGTLVVVGVVLDRSTPERFATFEAAIGKLPVLLDCYLVAGDFDYFVTAQVGDGERRPGNPGQRTTDERAAASSA